eukprot:4873391-Pyramimonas_sp.AAC.1
MHPSVVAVARCFAPQPHHDNALVLLQESLWRIHLREACVRVWVELPSAPEARTVIDRAPVRWAFRPPTFLHEVSDRGCL